MNKENKSEKKYSIEELSELTGYSKRTIRFYIQENIIDPPAGRGRGGFYFDSHLNSLRLIKKLQDRGMSLSSISKYIEHDYGHIKNNDENACMNEKQPLFKEVKFNRLREPRERARIMESSVLKDEWLERNQRDVLYCLDMKEALNKQEEPERDVWIKYKVSPGIEISIRKDIEEKHKRKINDMLRIIREIIGKEKE